MTIIRNASYLDQYRVSGTLEPWRMAGRSSAAFTQQVTRFILEHFPLSRGDAIVDVGCGDGSLLAAVAGDVAERVGITSSKEEAASLRRLHPHLDIRVGLCDAIPVKDEFASKTICNGVLVILDDQAAVERALRELARITRKGGMLYVGEIPSDPEATSGARSSPTTWIRACASSAGLRAFAYAIRELLDASAIRERVPIFYKNENPLWFPPQTFLAMAARAGLKCASQHTDANGRVSYVFNKP